jgi:hypothetical protein
MTECIDALTNLSSEVENLIIKLMPLPPETPRIPYSYIIPSLRPKFVEIIENDLKKPCDDVAAKCPIDICTDFGIRRQLLAADSCSSMIRVLRNLNENIRIITELKLI